MATLKQEGITKMWGQILRGKYLVLPIYKPCGTVHQGARYLSQKRNGLMESSSAWEGP
jgi:hypothetical protein